MTLYFYARFQTASVFLLFQLRSTDGINTQPIKPYMILLAGSYNLLSQAHQVKLTTW